MPSTVFGFCRCKCPSTFGGPRCQLKSGKRGISGTGGFGNVGGGYFDSKDYADDGWYNVDSMRYRKKRQTHNA